MFRVPVIQSTEEEFWLVHERNAFWVDSALWFGLNCIAVTLDKIFKITFFYKIRLFYKLIQSISLKIVRLLDLTVWVLLRPVQNMNGLKPTLSTLSKRGIILAQKKHILMRIARLFRDNKNVWAKLCYSLDWDIH